MTSLVRTYGRPLTAVICVLAAFWVLALIVLPQLVMLQSSLWSMEQPADAAQVTLEIDRLYNDLTVQQMDLATAAPADKPTLQAKIDATQAEIARLEAVETQPRKVWGLQNYTRMSGLHLRIFLRTIAYAALVTVLALVVCYPIAYVVARTRSSQKAALLLLGLVIPYAINELLRVYAWLMILDYQGVLNTLLDWLGVVDLESRQWVPFLEYPAATFAAMVYAYILFMVFPIYNTVETLDPNQIEAARDLGAPWWRIHWRVVIPFAKPGITSGCTMVFMLAAGALAAPQILGGPSSLWFTQIIYRTFFESVNWPRGAAYAVILLVVCTLLVLLVMRLFKVRLGEVGR